MLRHVVTVNCTLPKKVSPAGRQFSFDDVGSIPSQCIALNNRYESTT
jgi:hypothetical protein